MLVRGGVKKKESFTKLVLILNQYYFAEVSRLTQDMDRLDNLFDQFDEKTSNLNSRLEQLLSTERLVVAPVRFFKFLRLFSTFPQHFKCIFFIIVFCVVMAKWRILFCSRCSYMLRLFSTSSHI